MNIYFFIIFSQSDPSLHSMEIILLDVKNQELKTRLVGNKNSRLYKEYYVSQQI